MTKAPKRYKRTEKVTKFATYSEYRKHCELHNKTISLCYLLPDTFKPVYQEVTAALGKHTMNYSLEDLIVSIVSSRTNYHRSRDHEVCMESTRQAHKIRSLLFPYLNLGYSLSPQRLEKLIENAVVKVTNHLLTLPPETNYHDPFNLTSR